MHKRWLTLALLAASSTLSAVDFPKDKTLEQRQQLTERQIEQKLWEKDRRGERQAKPKPQWQKAPQLRPSPPAGAPARP